VIATEKLTRKASPARPEAARQEALAEVDFLGPEPGGNGMMKRLLVYTQRPFRVVKEKDKLDQIHDELNQFAEATHGTGRFAGLLLQPLLLVREKRDGIGGVSGADPSCHFLGLLAEKHRMRCCCIQRQFEDRWKEEHRMLSDRDKRVELDPDVSRRWRGRSKSRPIARSSAQHH